MITEFPEVDPVRVGHPFDVSCNASGVPSPTVALYINGEQSFSGSSVRHVITSASIKLDNGTYECIASSTSRATGQPFPTDSKSIEVIVQGLHTYIIISYICTYIPICYCTDRPDRIRKNKVQYNAINLTAINLMWEEPFDSNSPITNYTVSCDKCPIKSTTVDATVTSLVITGLIPGVQYGVSVVAVNALASGPDGGIVMVQSATPGMNHKLV